MRVLNVPAIKAGGGDPARRPLCSGVNPVVDVNSLSLSK